MSFAAIAQIESGRRTNVRPGTLRALAEALDVTVDHLVGGPGDRGLLDHRALLYRSEAEFAGSTVPFLRGAIDANASALVVTTPPRIDLLREDLGGDADRVRFERSARWYRSPLDAITSYRDFLREQVAAGSSWVCLVGEPVWPSTDDGIARWVTYEAAINLIFAASPVTVMCPYDVRSLDPAVVRSARRTHPSSISDAGQEPNPGYRDPERFLFDR